MNIVKPIKRKDFITKLRKLGFIGPFSGGKHQYMIYKNYRRAIPSNKEYSITPVNYILR